MCIYIYIYTNLISASIHGYQKKEKKPPGTRDKNISNHRPEKKEKNIIGHIERKDLLVTPVEKNQEICSHIYIYIYIELS